VALDEALVALGPKLRARLLVADFSTVATLSMDAAAEAATVVVAARSAVAGASAAAACRTAAR
jgi:hypothetical protein